MIPRLAEAWYEHNTWQVLDEHEGRTHERQVRGSWSGKRRQVCRACGNTIGGEDDPQFGGSSRWHAQTAQRALYDIVAVFLHATIDEVAAVLAPYGLLEGDECFLLLKALERHRSGGSSSTRESSDCPRARSSRSCGRKAATNC